MIRGTALTAQGQAQEGLILIRDGIDAIRSTGTNIARSRDLGMFAEAQHALGQIEDGLATEAEALAFVEQTNEHYIEADLYRLQGELTLDSDAASQACNVELNAENCFQRAIKIAKRQQARRRFVCYPRYTTGLAKGSTPKICRRRGLCWTSWDEDSTILQVCCT